MFLKVSKNWLNIFKAVFMHGTNWTKLNDQITIILIVACKKPSSQTRSFTRHKGNQIYNVCYKAICIYKVCY